MTIQDTHHGLSIVTTADDHAQADKLNNLRLSRPVPFAPVSTTFNDASSNYANRFGHEGIDFACPMGTLVRAMYGGQVVRIQREYLVDSGAYNKNNTNPYGVWVEIESFTDTGKFLHLYGHFAHPKHLLIDPPEEITKEFIASVGADEFNTKPYTDIKFTCEDLELACKVLELETRVLDSDGVVTNENAEVCKGQELGLSSDTAAPGQYHLHVHLKPFNTKDMRYDRFDCPATKVPAPDKDNPVAERILGCVDFMCFLPPDDDLPEITDEGPLLSSRDAYACIDVYPLPSEDVGKLGIINGSKIGCYAITGKFTGAPAENYPVWWQIQWEEGRIGWVPVKGPAGVSWNCPNTATKSVGDVVWIQTHGNTQNVPVAWPPAPQDLQADEQGSAVVVSWEPSAVPLYTPRHLQVTGYRARESSRG